MPLRSVCKWISFTVASWLLDASWLHHSRNLWIEVTVFPSLIMRSVETLPLQFNLSSWTSFRLTKYTPNYCSKSGSYSFSLLDYYESAGNGVYEQLNLLANCQQKEWLSINYCKNKIIPLGRVSLAPRWIMLSKSIELFNSFRYLGGYFVLNVLWRPIKMKRCLEIKNSMKSHDYSVIETSGDSCYQHLLDEVFYSMFFGEDLGVWTDAKLNFETFIIKHQHCHT